MTLMMLLRTDSLVCRDGRWTVSVLVMVRLVRFTPALSELPYSDPDIFRSWSFFPDTKILYSFLILKKSIEVLAHFSVL